MKLNIIKTHSVYFYVLCLVFLGISLFGYTNLSLLSTTNQYFPQHTTYYEQYDTLSDKFNIKDVSQHTLYFTTINKQTVMSKQNMVDITIMYNNVTKNHNTLCVRNENDECDDKW